MGELLVIRMDGNMVAGTVTMTEAGTAMAADGRARLLLTGRGAAQVSVGKLCFVIPAGQALYLPPGTSANVVSRGEPTIQVVSFVAAAFQHDLPETVSPVRASALLRELVEAVAAIDPVAAGSSRHHRLFQVLVDQIRTAERVASALSLPTGRDKRLRRVTTRLIENPGSDVGLPEWAGIAGASSRTLARLFMTETGMNFKNWRQKARILRAIELLSQGESTTRVAYDVGYDTPNAFIASFKATTGCTPSRYNKTMACPPPASSDTTQRPAIAMDLA